MIRDGLLRLDHRVAVVAHRLGRTLGYRGAWLIVIANFDLVWAWSWLDPKTAQPAAGAPAFRAVTAMGAHIDSTHPLLIWGILLGAVGLICGIQAWSDNDRWAFGAALGVKLVMTLLTLAAWSTAGVQSVRGIIIWVTLGLFTLVMSRFPERNGLRDGG